MERSPHPRSAWLPILIGISLLPGHAAAARASVSVVDQAVAAACSKDVVLLGELPTHGEAEGMQAKAQIVRRLVETCGFHAVIFEAPIYEFEFAGAPLAGRQPAVRDLDNGVGLFWTTNELSGWRNWLAGQWSTGDLRVGGMDDQISVTARLTKRLLPQLVGSSVPVARREACRAVVSRHLYWTYNDDAPYDETAKAALSACAAEASRLVPSSGPGSASSAMLGAFARYAARQVDENAVPTRDDSMAEAVRWHMSTWARGTRVIVWTATVHAARAVHGLSYVPMGERLAAIYGARLFSIGFTAAGGTTSMAGAKPSALPTALPGYLEQVALGQKLQSVYLDHKQLAHRDGEPSLLLSRVSSQAWSRAFDAVVVFREEHAPTFPPRPRGP